MTAPRTLADLCQAEARAIGNLHPRHRTVDHGVYVDAIDQRVRLFATYVYTLAIADVLSVCAGRKRLDPDIAARLISDACKGITPVPPSKPQPSS